jgi:hypothetical protein
MNLRQSCGTTCDELTTWPAASASGGVIERSRSMMLPVRILSELRLNTAAKPRGGHSEVLPVDRWPRGLGPLSPGVANTPAVPLRNSSFAAESSLLCTYPGNSPKLRMFLPGWSSSVGFPSLGFPVVRLSVLLTL